MLKGLLSCTTVISSLEQREEHWNDYKENGAVDVRTLCRSGHVTLSPCH